MSNEKKKTIIFTVILAIIAISLISILVVQKLKENGNITNNEVNQIMKDFDKYYNSKEKTVIYYASTTCGWCSLQTPILETIAEDYDMDYLYVDSSKLGKKQINEVTKKLEIKASTPMTVIVEKGKVIDIASGYQDPKEYVKFFASNGLIPEDAVYSKENNLNFIEYNTYEELISDGGTHVIVIGQTTCSHCIAIKPTLNSIAGEYNLVMNYINIDTLTESQYSNFSTSLKDIEYNDPDFVNEGSFGTPLILIVKNNKVSSYIAGERSKSQLVREFTKAGLISK